MRARDVAVGVVLPLCVVGALFLHAECAAVRHSLVVQKGDRGNVALQLSERIAHAEETLSHTIRRRTPDDTRSVRGKGGSSQFKVDFFGFSENGLSETYKAAVLRGLKIIADAWKSGIRLQVAVRFEDIGPDKLATKEELGWYVVSFGKGPNAEGQYVPPAAAEAITNEEKNSHARVQKQDDISMKLNTRIKWYVGASPKVPPNQWDLQTVVMHEAYHSLIFTGDLKVTKRNNFKSANRSQDIFTRYDRLLVNKDGCSVLGYLDDTVLAKRLGRTNHELLGAAVTHGSLFFDTGKQRIPLFAPSRLTAKAPIYHLDMPKDGSTKLMMPTNVLRDVRVSTIAPEILAIQRAYLDPNYIGAKKCKFPLANPFESIAGRGSVPNNTDHYIAGMPAWAFALLLVAVCIVLFAVLFCLCTCGAFSRKKHSGKHEWVKKITCCCAGIDYEQDANDLRRFIDESKSRLVRSARSSLERARSAARLSLDRRSADRNSVDPNSNGRLSFEGHGDTVEDGTDTSTRPKPPSTDPPPVTEMAEAETGVIESTNEAKDTKDAANSAVAEAEVAESSASPEADSSSGSPAQANTDNATKN